MTWQPMLMAPVAIQLHALAALAAFVLGIVQFVATKGTGGIGCSGGFGWW